MKIAIRHRVFDAYGKELAVAGKASGGSDLKITYKGRNVALGTAVRSVVGSVGATYQLYGGEVVVGRYYHEEWDPFSPLDAGSQVPESLD